MRQAMHLNHPLAHSAPPSFQPADLIGLVLAGGRSSRMGRDKAALCWKGPAGEISLLDHAIALLRESGVQTVKVSGDRPGHDCVADQQPGAGPGVAISDMLAHLPPTAAVLIVPVDMPCMTPALLRRLLQAVGQTSDRAAHFDGFPLPALLPARAPDGQPLAADSLRRLHAQAGSVSLPLAEGEAAAFVNVNTPQEWEAVRKIP